MERRPVKWKVERIPLDDEAAFKKIQDFCTLAGLPFFPPVRSHLLAQFVIRDAKGKLGAAGRLECTYDHPFVEEIAVREDLRRSGLGSMIVRAILDEASERDIEMIWVMARAPEFFDSLGFEPAPEKDLLAKLKEECKVCRDHIAVCNPVLMKRKTGT
jgi:N-acetylglutamate synthase-like GNAT family acetyltransferase